MALFTVCSQSVQSLCHCEHDGVMYCPLFLVLSASLEWLQSLFFLTANNTDNSINYCVTNHSLSLLWSCPQSSVPGSGRTLLLWFCLYGALQTMKAVDACLRYTGDSVGSISALLIDTISIFYT